LSGPLPGCASVKLLLPEDSIHVAAKSGFPRPTLLMLLVYSANFFVQQNERFSKLKHHLSN